MHMKKYWEPIIHIMLWGIGYFLILKYTSTIGDFRKDTGPYWFALLFGMQDLKVNISETEIVLIDGSKSFNGKQSGE